MTSTKKAAAKRAPKQKPFAWFDGVELENIAREFAEVRGKPGARMEVHGEGKHTTIFFHADGYEGPPNNNAHVCPIDCP